MTLNADPVDPPPAAESMTAHVTTPADGRQLWHLRQHRHPASTTTSDGTDEPLHRQAEVLSADVTIDKDADNATVNAGEDIGFTVTVRRKGVETDDPLPAGTGVDWVLDVAGSDATCAITGTPPTETLNCGPVDLATGESLTAHVTSGTTVDSCGTYDNTDHFHHHQRRLDEAPGTPPRSCART